MIRLAVALTVALAAVASAQSPPGEDVRVTTDVSARRVYVGERVTVVYSLERAVPGPGDDALITPVRDVRIVEAPRFPGFWVNELETEDANPPGGPSAIGSIALRRLRLFPLESGALTIEPPSYSMIVYPSTPGVVDPMPGTVTRRADPATVEVVPLPDAGRPDTFGGAVGRFTVRATLEHPGGEAGQVSRVRVEIVGDGNLESTGPPRLERTDGVRVFPARRLSVDLGLSDPEALARAVWLLDVVPERAGTLALGPVAIDVFDPSARHYTVARSDPISLVVAEGAAPPPTPEPARTRGRGWLWWLGAAGAALALGAWIVARRRRQPSLPAPKEAVPARAVVAPAEVARLRVRLARAVAAAETAREAGDARALHARLLEGLGDLVATRYGVPASELTRERAAEALAAGGVPAPVVERVLRLYDHCVEAGYAPRAAAPSREPVEAAARLFEALVRAE